jgi:effector-binding domain-containing protein
MTMTYYCELKEMPAQHTLYLRTTTAYQNLPQFFGAAYSAIFQHLGTLQQQPAGPPYAAYYNMDMQNLDVEAGFPVSGLLAGKGEIKAGEIPAGKYTTCLYIGPYDGIASAYTALTQWIQENKYEPSGIAYELYLDDPTNTPPQELKTQILFQLKNA